MQSNDPFLIFWKTDQGRIEVTGFYVTIVFRALPTREILDYLAANLPERGQIDYRLQAISKEHPPLFVLQARMQRTPESWSDYLHCMNHLLTAANAEIAWLHGEEVDFHRSALDEGPVYAGLLPPDTVLTNVVTPSSLGVLTPEQLQSLRERLEHS